MYSKYVKRGFDIFFSILALLIGSPLFILLYLLIQKGLGSPVIFHQDRPGKDGKIFRLYKFRTMTNKKDENGNLLPDEQRLTALGRLLRKTSLDELPEFFNILKGDMSFVGPRPLLVRYLPYYTESEKHRHDVRPGLTGLAQINGRNALNWEERFRYDLAYVTNVNFILDVKIIFLTVGNVLRHKGVQSGDAQTIPDFDSYRGKGL